MDGNSIIENPGCKAVRAAAAATRAGRRPCHTAGDTRMRSADLGTAPVAHRDRSGMAPATGNQPASRGCEWRAYPFAPKQS